jgi:hypothetical protein
LLKSAKTVSWGGTSGCRPAQEHALQGGRPWKGRRENTADEKVLLVALLLVEFYEYSTVHRRWFRFTIHESMREGSGMDWDCWARRSAFEEVRSVSARFFQSTSLTRHFSSPVKPSEAIPARGPGLPNPVLFLSFWDGVAVSGGTHCVRTGQRPNAVWQVPRAGSVRPF